MEEISQAFRVLGDPTRLRLLRLLAQAPLNVTELVSIVGIAQPSVSHHLGKLRGLSLVREERQAGFSYYSLAVDPTDPRWPLITLAQGGEDTEGDGARLTELLRRRQDRQQLNERLLEPGQSWYLWAGALGSLLPPLEVADFGCGTGLLSVSIARWAKSVVAVDSSKAALDEARARAKKAGLKNVSFLREDLQKLSLPSGRTDLVVISQSLHHMEAPERVLEQAARILRKGGTAMVLELMPHEESWVVERLGHKHLGFAPEWIERAMSQAGFGRISLEAHPREGGSPFRAFLMTGVKR
jgi:ArsR family transcriptional regulator